MEILSVKKGFGGLTGKSINFVEINFVEINFAFKDRIDKFDIARKTAIHIAVNAKYPL